MVTATPHPSGCGGPHWGRALARWLGPCVRIVAWRSIPVQTVLRLLALMFLAGATLALCRLPRLLTRRA
ncbi:MAG: hypothetical protein AMXMBFR64_55800 [Myxococcales bacterium]